VCRLSALPVSYKIYTTLIDYILICHSFDWLATFHLELLGMLVILHRTPPQVANRGKLSRYRGTGDIKYAGWNWKLTYDGLPRGNQDLGRSGNCKWEAALAKLTTGGDEVNRYSYRTKTDRRRWEPSCGLSGCDVEGTEKPPYYDLKAATKVLWSIIWPSIVNWNYPLYTYDVSL